MLQNHHSSLMEKIDSNYFKYIFAVLRVSLVKTHGASSCCGWREDLQIRRVDACILNKQLRTAEKGRSSSLSVGLGFNNPTQNCNLLRNVSKRLRPGLILWYYQSEGKRKADLELGMSLQGRCNEVSSGGFKEA
jgi:hypothetical protein